MSSFFLSLDENEKYDDISRLQHLEQTITSSIAIQNGRNLLVVSVC